MFLALKFFKKAPPEILNRRYKTYSRSDHRAKFRVDRQTRLGDLATEIKKNICGKT